MTQSKIIQVASSAIFAIIMQMIGFADLIIIISDASITAIIYMGLIYMEISK